MVVKFNKTNYSGYLLKNRDYVLAELAALGYYPKFQKVILEHITYKYPDKNTAPMINSAEINGYVCGDGIEAVIVSIDGAKSRPDNKTYHITYSLDDGHKPGESNNIIVTCVIEKIFPPIILEVEPF